MPEPILIAENFVAERQAENPLIKQIGKRERNGISVPQTGEAARQPLGSLGFLFAPATNAPIRRDRAFIESTPNLSPAAILNSGSDWMLPAPGIIACEVGVLVAEVFSLGRNSGAPHLSEKSRLKIPNPEIIDTRRVRDWMTPTSPPLLEAVFRVANTGHATENISKAISVRD